VALSQCQAFTLFGLMGTIGVLALGLSPKQQQSYPFLLGAALWGFLLFAETPDVFTLAGMALITIAGILVSPSRRRGRPV